MGELRPKDISKSCPDHSARSNQVNSQILLVSKSQYFHCAIIFLIIPKNSKNKVLNLEKTLETHQSCCLDLTTAPQTLKVVSGMLMLHLLTTERKDGFIQMEMVN